MFNLDIKKDMSKKEINFEIAKDIAKIAILITWLLLLFIPIAP